LSGHSASLAQTETETFKKRKKPFWWYVQHLHFLAVIFSIYITCKLYLTSV
jgi:hypothetical protein